MTNVEPNSDQWRFAGEVVRKLPTLRRLRETRSAKPVGAATGRLTSTPPLRPWIGDEAAIALLPDGRRASSLILVRVADQARGTQLPRGTGPPP